MNVDNNNYGWESSLSMMGNEQSRTARPRHGSIPILLRPVFMNAVEVGYSYAHCDREKKLNVRGVTIALWHFICRGHQAIALLPYCFKNYPEKSTNYPELMMLYRLNLIEFTPGYGSEKYAEVNRIMVNRAFETGGCLVARSQMQGITDNNMNLIDVVEQRLLMPTFNGDDIMFPIDGPLGRNGPSLEQTLQCDQGTPDWRLCAEHQLLLSDQRHWLEKLALLVPEKVIWTRMIQMIQAGGTEDRHDYENNPPMPPSPPPPSQPPQLLENPFQPRPPPLMAQSNPSIFYQNNDLQYPGPQQQPVPLMHQYQTPNHEYYYQYNDFHCSIPNPHQYHQYKRNFTAPPRRHQNPNSPHLNPYLPHHHPHGGRSSGTRLIIRYGEAEPRVVGNWKGGGTTQGSQEIQNLNQNLNLNSQNPEASEAPEEGIGAIRQDSEIATESVESGVQEPEELEETPSESTELDESVARELQNQMIVEGEKLEKETSEQKKKDEILAKLSQIFGYAKSIRVMSKYPNISKLPLLVEKCLVEPEQDGDSREFEENSADSESSPASTSPESSSESSDDVIEEEEDLIDFSEEPLVKIDDDDDEVEPKLEIVETTDYSNNSEILELVDLIF